jgi:hypothetical protein
VQKSRPENLPPILLNEDRLISYIPFFSQGLNLPSLERRKHYLLLDAALLMKLLSSNNDEQRVACYVDFLLTPRR